MWNSTLFSTIKNDLETNGFSYGDIEKMYSQFEPLDIEDIKLSRDKVVLAKGIYDRINDPHNYALFQDKWRLKHVLSYKAGHLNILRVPRLANDIADFYFDKFNVSNSEKA